MKLFGRGRREPAPPERRSLARWSYREYVIESNYQRDHVPPERRTWRAVVENNEVRQG